MATKIEWTEETWNPVVGCSPVSEGCRNCYAAREALRLAGNPNPEVSGPYIGTAEMRGLGAYRRPVFTGIVRVVEGRLTEPLRWKKPRRVFVNSMSDLFHEAVPFEAIDLVFAVMLAADRRHTFQILTKRPERAREYFDDLHKRAMYVPARGIRGVDYTSGRISELLWRRRAEAGIGGEYVERHWPLRNVWIGVSVEDQTAADERIPHLLRIPAAVRFLSCEPLLGPVDLERVGGDAFGRGRIDALNGVQYVRAHACEWETQPVRRVDWVIVGGESGPRARPCNVDWIRAIVAQCRTSGVPVFVKQLGAHPFEKRPAEAWPHGTDAALKNLGRGHPQQSWFPFREGWALTSTPAETYWLRQYRLRDRRGADPTEWPDDLRVREYPDPDRS